MLSRRPVNTLASVRPARVEPQFDRFCLTKDIDVAEPKYRTAVGRGRGGVARPSDFHEARLVRIRLEGSASGCDADCKRWVGAAIVQALASWRAGCTRCPAETLAGLEVDSDRYVAVKALDAAQFLADRAARIDIPDAAFLATAAFAMGAVNPAMGFQRFESADDLLALCGGTDLSGQVGILARAARSIACSAPLDACRISDGCKEILIRIGGAPNCEGPIACGLPDSNVTLNTRSYRFILGRADRNNSQSIALGTDTGQQSGKLIPLFPVVLHEVGHWFGLPHVDSNQGRDGRDEVMKDTGGDDNVCISRGALNMVNSAVDRTWPFRLTGSGALRYARPH